MGNFEIVAILNQYKDTLDDLIDSSDSESLDWAGPIDERFCNAPMSKGSLADCSEEDYLDENLPDRSSQLAPKAKDSQVRQRRVVAPQAGYGKSQGGGKDRWGNKINPVIGGSSDIEASVYYYVIDRY